MAAESWSSRSSASYGMCACPPGPQQGGRPDLVSSWLLGTRWQEKMEVGEMKLARTHGDLNDTPLSQLWGCWAPRSVLCPRGSRFCLTCRPGAEAGLWASGALLWGPHSCRCPSARVGTTLLPGEGALRIHGPHQSLPTAQVPPSTHFPSRQTSSETPALPGAPAGKVSLLLTAPL